MALWVWLKQVSTSQVEIVKQMSSIKALVYIYPELKYMCLPNNTQHPPPKSPTHQMATVTPDVQFLELFGLNNLLDIVTVLVSSMFFGAFMVLLFMAILILCNREGKRSARIGLLLAIIAMFILSGFHFWSDTALFMASIKSVLVDDIEESFAAKHTIFVHKVKRLNDLVDVVLPLEIIIGDSIVLWRAWALRGASHKLVYIALLCLVGTSACSFAYIGCYAQNNWPSQPPDTCISIEIAALTLSVATNIFGTLVIGYTLWFYRQAVEKYLKECKHKVRAEKILVLLLESGCIYSILWAVELILLLVPSPPTFAGKIVQQIVTAASVQLVCAVYRGKLLVTVATSKIKILYPHLGWDTPLPSTNTDDQSVVTM
ncbi:hypothetical protein L218DRAFT_948785 [Marasmius fiardii PR-910]|nr:hypothetical protein L218DRAFT_948785 [Marasmius fiardii PR-910]